MTKINYEKLWFDVCEEKRQLQIENRRLDKDSQYWRKECEKFERLLHNKKFIKFLKE